MIKPAKALTILFVLLIGVVHIYSQNAVNNAPTLGPVVRAYYRALRKKDDRAIERVIQIKFLNQLKADMKAEHKRHIAAYLAETDRPHRKIEVRNEKIKGDWGNAEVRGGTYLNWTPLDFVKEDGVWKLSFEKSPTMD